jgi:hypothetical protein
MSRNITIYMASHKVFLETLAHDLQDDKIVVECELTNAVDSLIVPRVGLCCLLSI